VIISLDTETTGGDFYRNSRPFLVTICELGKQPIYWEWDVDPLTRIPSIPGEDKDDIRDFLEAAEIIVLQNSKFDATALWSIDIELPWEKVYDLLGMAHILGSNRPKDLYSLTIEWLGHDEIKESEKVLDEACDEARRWARSYRPKWRIAKKDDEDMPSAKSSKMKKLDMWLPRAVCKEMGYSENHPWWTVTSQYANDDSAATVALFEPMRQEIVRQGRWATFCAGRALPSIAQKMERRGVTVSAANLERMEAEFSAGSAKASSRCVEIARSCGFDLQLPKGAVNNSLKEFMLDVLQLPPQVKRKSTTGNASLDKDAMKHYMTVFEESTKQYQFVKSLTEKRIRDTAVTYMQAYKRFWMPLDGLADRWYVLHPNLNVFGTDTLRMTSKDPNEQNISKKEDFNLRYCFGPAPGREWYSLDYKNVERRIPAYEAGETEIIALFERPDDPPYFGSEHLLVAHVLHKRLFEDCKGKDGKVDGRVFKDRYKATHYQKCKNGNFAIQYQCGEETADLTFGVPGAYYMLKERFSKQTELNNYWVSFAEKHGYVETIPDKTVDPQRGYPLLCSRSERGYIVPTVPLNYHTSGTAMWIMRQAMVQVEPILEHWRDDGFDGWLVMNVHDELVLDFPASKDRSNPENLWRAHVIREVMERCGSNVGIPTPVNVEYHPETWGSGISM